MRLPRFVVNTAWLVCLLVAWSVGASYVQARRPRGEVLLPGPWNVVQDLPGLGVFVGRAGEATYESALHAVLIHSLASTQRLVGGVLLGAALGIGTGLVLGWSPRLRSVAEGPLLTVRTIPILALIPLFLTWFGGREIGAVIFIGFAVFAMLLVNTLEAIRNVDPLMQQFAGTLGASKFHVYRTVVIPSIVPELIGGMRVVLGLAWAILLAAEYLAAQSGLGRVLILAQQYSMTSRMILVMLLLMLYTLVVDLVFQKVSERATRWVPRQRSAGGVR